MSTIVRLWPLLPATIPGASEIRPAADRDREIVRRLAGLRSNSSLKRRPRKAFSNSSCQAGADGKPDAGSLSAEGQQGGRLGARSLRSLGGFFTAAGGIRVGGTSSRPVTASGQPSVRARARVIARGVFSAESSPAR